MKTPDEIKKGLESCMYTECVYDECPYFKNISEKNCVIAKDKDTLAYIQWLEERADGLNAPKVKYDLGWSIGVLYGLTAQCSDEAVGRLHEVIDTLAELARFKEE